MANGKVTPKGWRLDPGWLDRLPWAAAVLAGLAVLGWFVFTRPPALKMRVPGTDRPPGMPARPEGNPVLAGKTIRGPGQPADLPGRWPGFRGADLSAIAREAPRLARDWSARPPQPLWQVDLGEGYAGPAVEGGCVYVFDYDQKQKQDALRCLSLADGREIWRFAYPVTVKRNHGMSRTVPTIAGGRVVGMGPKCHVVCVDAMTGELKWGLDLVGDFGATVPQWYAGQCPLVDGNRVILAPGGPEALLMAVSLETGEVIWKTPNPNDWKMTHSSIVPMEFGSVRQYVYCASRGVVGVAADDGRLLWSSTEWKISIATVPSPVVVGPGRIFFSGGYNAGCLMMRLRQEGDRFVPEVEWRLKARDFGATQQTPILYENHLYGVRPDGAMVCLDLDGKIRWTSGPDLNFGLGPYLIAGGLLLAMDDDGVLRLMEATPERFALLGEYKVFENGREAWGPLCLAGERLLARDLTRMACLQLPVE